ncbi:MAG: response regulator [Solirubrobacteraceae bacterium]
MRIALCDDDEDFRSLMGLCVREDAELDLVASARAVAPLLNALPTIDVEGVLLDWMLPGETQEDAVRSVRAALPDARIVVLSAVVRASAEERALAAGADGYVEKNGGARDLLDRCRLVLLPSPG